MAARQVLSRIEEGYHPLVNRLHDVFFPRGSSSTPLSHLYRMDVETAEVKLALQAGCAMLKRSHNIHKLALIMVLALTLIPVVPLTLKPTLIMNLSLILTLIITLK